MRLELRPSKGESYVVEGDRYELIFAGSQVIIKDKFGTYHSSTLKALLENIPKYKRKALLTEFRGLRSSSDNIFFCDVFIVQDDITHRVTLVLNKVVFNKFVDGEMYDGNIISRPENQIYKNTRGIILDRESFLAEAEGHLASIRQSQYHGQNDRFDRRGNTRVYTLITVQLYSTDTNTDTLFREAVLKSSFRSHDLLGCSPPGIFHIALDLRDKAALERVLVKLEAAIKRSRISLFNVAAVFLDPQKDATSTSILVGGIKKTQELLSNHGFGEIRVSEKEFSDEFARNRYVREALEKALEKSKENPDLKMHLQGIYDAEGNLYSCEALARLVDPKNPNRFISPAEFITLAEREGYISAIGDYMTELAIMQIAEWMRSGRVPVPKIAINVSPVQLGDDTYFNTIARLCEKYGVPIDKLKLEIIENSFKGVEESGGIESGGNHSKKITERLRSIQGMRVEILLDDFGTGFSNWARLMELPVNTVKIDRSFVQKLNTEDGQRICRSMITASKEMGKTVIAEGVETEEQFHILRSLGCNYFQGYLFHKPSPASELPDRVSIPKE